MSKLTESRTQTIEDMLAAGWVLLEYSLMRLRFVGRDDRGNRYEIKKAALPRGELIDAEGNRYWRCKASDLKLAGAEIYPAHNVSENR